MLSDEKSLKYQQILNSIPHWDFGTPAKNLMKTYENTINKTFLSVTSQITAPVLVSFVIWVLYNAEKQNIRNLLFISRDGLVMYEIADILCKKWGIMIECKYFHASRSSLGLPMFAIDKNYALEKLCSLDSGNKTLRDLYKAAGITEFRANLNELVNKKTKEKLLHDHEFQKYALQVSEVELENTRKYFIEYMPESKFAIVDSGWRGSIQEAFGKLYKHFFNRSPSDVTGFYFGMLRTPFRSTGKYFSYYFSPDVNFYRLKGFCIDLFECLCAANHGRVVGYTQEKDGIRMVPVFAEEMLECSSSWDAGKQIELCIAYTKIFASQNCKTTTLPNTQIIDKLFKIFMNSPSREEAVVYGAIPFSRSVIENNVGTLARTLSDDELKTYTFTHRIKTKIIRQPKMNCAPVFWHQGSAVLSNASVLRKLDMKLLLFAYRLKVWLKSLR
ncbi:MAG: hypothetical protein FWC71_04350 [Defluviitaleaceae bacterium]|nr:hypothetical protein [Defluviitaleaceae bacterium]